MPAAATPTFSVAAGIYTSVQTVSISSSTAGATIYYTTNGVAPTISSTVYSGPITVSSTETIEAVAVASGYTMSSVASVTYTINLPATIQSLKITAPGYAFLVNDAIQLTATSIYSDSTSRDVTSSVSWSVAPAAAATISTAGVLSATQTGFITVTATLNTISSTLKLQANDSQSTAGMNGFNWRSVNIQGMGYVTGLVIHPLSPYDIYIRTDVGGAYRYDRSEQRWIPLLDQYGRGESEIYGVESLAIDPKDANTVYIAAAHGRVVNGSTVTNPAEVLVSHDRGATWNATGLSTKNLYIGPNDNYRGTTGERLTVDPIQSGVLWFASRTNGLWRGTVTTAPAMDWEQVQGLPASATSPGFTFVLLDPNGGTTSSGTSKTVYTGATGSGVYASTDGGSIWAQITATPNPTRANLTTDGTLLVSFGGDESATVGSVGRYHNGQWQDITPLGKNKSYSGITSDPTSPQKILVAENSNRNLYRSTDQGNTWTPLTLGADSYVPEYYPASPGMWGDAALAIDPANPKRVWQTNGYGVVETEDYTAASTTWTWLMNNLEELVVQKVKVPPLAIVPGTNVPGADLMSVVADMVGFRHASRDIVPTATIDSFLYVAQATGISYCASQPQYAVFIGWDETNVTKPMSGITSDNGLTWKHITNTSPGTGGKIVMAADNPNNMVWSPINAAPVYTTDGGSTWSPAMLGSSKLSASWQLSNEWWSPDVLAADQVAAGTFYYYNNGDFYASTDKGATWTLRNSTWPQNPQWVVNTSIVPNPVIAGDIWMTFAPGMDQSTNYQLLHSTDGGRSFTAITTLSWANYVAFGKGSTVPTIYVHGRAPGDTADAIYKSEDTGATWLRISDPSTMQFGEINSLEGDMRTQDLVYVGFGGRGIVYGFGTKSGIAMVRRTSQTE